VAVLIETGSVTRKIEAGFTVPILTTDRYSNQNDFAKALYSRRNVQYNRSVSVKYWLRVALPALQDAPVPAHRTVVRVSSAENLEDKGVEVTAVRVEDLDAQARLAYAEKQPTVVMRAIARALAKYLATETASNQDQGLGALVNLLGVVTETADTRSWTTLPGSIDLARLDLEPGKYRIDVEVLDPQGALLVKRQFENVEVRSNGLEVRRVRLR
jgi:hypothetical protein